ncbi:MAG: choice-of-anchor J domain-containing protein [Dysgonamonadaceae bacterium]|nr:choice-of-anchor J domain-containing protein [Dysgonamonadaceae bacterium]
MPLKQKHPNNPVRKEAVKSHSGQKDFKDLSPARQEKLLALKEKAAAKDAKLQKTAAVSQSNSANEPGLFFEDFEKLSTTTLPDGWVDIPTPDGNGWTTTPLGDINGHSGNGYAKIIFHATVAHNAWAITPAINLTAGKVYRISFWAIIVGDDPRFERLEVKLGTAPAANAMTTLIYDNEGTDILDWSKIAYEYTPEISGDYYIGFHSFSSANALVTMFDDVKVEEIIMTAPSAPANFTVTPGAGGTLSAELSWTNPAVTNGGETLTSLTSIVIERDGKPLHTIDNPVPGVVLTWTDNTPSNGDHTYTIYATNGDGASDPVSQTVSVGVDPCSIPIPVAGYFEGAEDMSTLDCWYNYVANNDVDSWRFSELSHSGSHSFMHTFAVGDQDDWLISPMLSIPAGRVFELSFWSYNNYFHFYEKNSLLIARNNGKPVIDDFEEVWSPTSVTDSWVKTKIDLTEYAGDTIRLAFRYQGNDAHVWYVDDLSISELFTYDSGVTAVIKPRSGSLTASEAPRIKVKNFGSKALSSVPVKMVIDNGTPISGIISSIPAGTEVEYPFETTIDLSELKSYIIKAWTELESDENAINDTTTVTVINVGDCTVSTFPYIEDAENDLKLFCWTDFYYDEDGPEIGWAATNSVHHTGKRSVYHVDGPQGIPQDGWLVSPKIQIPATGYYRLSFWSYIDYVYYYKNGKNSVLIATDKEDLSIDDYEEVWLPETVLGSTWMETKINLYKYAGKTIRIAFRYQGEYAHQWYLDDLKIEELKGANAGVTAISSPKSGTNLTAAETITVKVKNFGVETLNRTPVFVQIDDEKTFSEVIPDAINIEGEKEFTFTATINLSEVKTYTIKVYTRYPNDTDNSDDATTIVVTNYGNKAVIGSSTSITSCDIKFVDDGLNESYFSGTNEIQTITFYPETPDKRVTAKFTSFASVPYEVIDFFGTITEYPGDTLFVYNGNKADENRLIASLTGHPNSDLLSAPFRSSALDGSLTFVFQKRSAVMEAGWEANINCVVPRSNDIAVEQILSPVKGGEAAAEVKLKLANYGINAVSSADVTYVLNNGVPVVETFTGNLMPGETAEFTFEQTVDVSAYIDYTLTVYVSLPNDNDLTNDTISISFANNDITFSGYRIFDTSWLSMNEKGAVSFELLEPWTVTPISNYKDGNNTIFAGTYFDGHIYAYSYDEETNPANFIKLNSDWTEVSKVATTGNPSDMTYDYSTGRLYAVSYDVAAKKLLLQTVNPETGVLTAVAPITGITYLYTIAADLNGNLYGVDLNGTLVSIDKTTGVATPVGSTGINPRYFQSMTFDHNSGRLFWAMCNVDKEGRLIELDPTSGAATNWDVLGSNAEVVALYTIYDPVLAPELINVNINDGDPEVDPELSIIATFNRGITGSNLSGITLTKRGTSASPEFVTLTPSIYRNVLTIAHDKLEYENSYDLLIPAGTINNYNLETALSFTTMRYTATPSLNARSFTVYPNPAKNAVYVSYVPENSVISILDLTGRTLENQMVTKSESNVRLDLNLAPGIYFIQVKSNNTKTVQRLIIK